MRDYDSDEEDEEVEICKTLAETLTRSPHLGLHVRRLILGTHCHDYESTAYHLEILKQCPLVEDVKIWGYNYELAEKYPAVLAGLKNLRSLNIIKYCLNDCQTMSLMGDNELLVLVKGWPRIEQIQVATTVAEYKHHKALERYCNKRGIKMGRP
jgi:hypothetical protein